MSLFMKVEISLIQYLDFLIQRQATSKPKELAQKLAMSERNVYRYLEYLQTDCGLALDYNQTRQSYVYTTPKQFELRLGKKS
jgi:transcriptional antiterminator